MQHLQYKTINEFRIKLGVPTGVKIVSVVRNPYDRILHELHSRKLISVESTQSQVFEELVKNYKTIISQYEYICDTEDNIVADISLFKYEDLSIDFKSVYPDFKCIPKPCPIPRDSLNKFSIHFINKVFKNDFEPLGYKMVNVLQEHKSSILKPRQKRRSY